MNEDRAYRLMVRAVQGLLAFAILLGLWGVFDERTHSPDFEMAHALTVVAGFSLALAAVSLINRRLKEENE